MVSICHKICKSKKWNFNNLLMPISFASMLGGTLTLLGSSTNLVAASLLEPEISLGIFELFSFSFPTLIVSYIYLIYISNISDINESKGCCIQSQNQLNINVQFFKICENSIVINNNVKDSGIQELQGLQLCGIQRYKTFISVLPRSYTTIQEDDVLIMIGTHYIANSSELIEKKIINIPSSNIDKSLFNIPQISSGKIGNYFSKLINKDCAQLEFKQNHKLILLGIMRHGNILTENIGKIKLKYNDLLIVNGDSSKKKLSKICRYVNYITNDTSEFHHNGLLTSDISFIVSFLVIILSGFVINHNNNNINSIIILLFLYIFQIITDEDINKTFYKYKNVILGTSASLLLSRCLEYNGIIILISKFFNIIIELPNIYIYLITHLVSSFSSLFLSNVAVVSILIPVIKLSCVNKTNLIYPLTFCIIHGASCCFASPTGYHTNLIINSIAGYQCKDFIKFGFLLHIICSFTFSISMYYIYK
jgi:uncharacterized protein with PhoU and TrkA domain